MKKWYDRQAGWVKLCLYFLGFTALFLLFWSCQNAQFFVNGKSFVQNDDSLANAYEGFGIQGRLMQDMISDLLGGKFRFFRVNFNLTRPTEELSLNPAFFFAAFVARTGYEFYFAFAVAFSLWLSGVSFSCYCFHMKFRRGTTLLASLVYVTSAYPLISSTKQLMFLTMLYMTPIILIGIERVLAQNKGLFLAVAVAVSAIFGVFLFYYICVAAALYCVVRVFTWSGEKLGWKVRHLFLTGGYYVLGIGLSGIWLVPYIYSIANSSRISEAANAASPTLLFFENSVYLNFIKNFFEGSKISSTYSLAGFSVIVLYPLIYIFLTKENRFLKWWAGTVLVLMNLPAWEAFAGLVQISGRWLFALGIAVCMATAYALPRLLDQVPEGGLTRRMNKFALGYAALMLILADDTRYYYTLGMIVLMILIINAIWRFPKIRPVRYVLIAAAALLSVSVNGYFTENEEFLSAYVDAGTVNDNLEAYMGAALRDLDDKDFYRVDMSRYESEVACNLPFFYGYNGISSFSNTIPADVYKYFSMTGNPGLVQANKFSNLNGRTTDCALACVKYYVTDKDNRSRVPYGYVKNKELSKNADYDVYENPLPLPIGFTYEDTISYKEFEKLNIAQKQECLLRQAVVKDGGKAKEYNSYEMENYEVELSGVELTDQGYQVKKSNAYIDIHVKQPVRSELFVELENIVYLNNNATSNRTCAVTVSYGNSQSDAGVIYGINGVRNNNINNLSFCVGNAERKHMRIRIRFSKRLNVYIGKIHVYRRSLKGGKADIKALREEKLTNTVIRTNQVDGEITTSSRKLLCFSIPYSEGWKCYLNGREVPLEKVNIMYMGTWLDPGKYHVTLKYSTPLMWLGTLLTSVSGALFVLVLLLGWMKVYPFASETDSRERERKK